MNLKKKMKINKKNYKKNIKPFKFQFLYPEIVPYTLIHQKVPDVLPEI